MTVVGIHGIAHTHLTFPEIEREELPAIQGGLEEAEFPRIAKEDFTIAAYGTLFRPAGTRSGTSPNPKLTEDITNKWEKLLLIELWQEATALFEANQYRDYPLGEDPTIQGSDVEHNTESNA